MISFLFVTGPPFDAPLWDAVVRRIRNHGHSASAVEMFDGGDGSIDFESNRLAERILTTKRPIVLVAHGTAVPAAIEACRKLQPDGLVLSNGPLYHTDLFTRLLIRWAKLPAAVTQKVVSPKRSMSFLASSMGLRRLVVNPYVMDHDTTVMVCGPIFASTARFDRMRSYLKTLMNFDWTNAPADVPILVCYGDDDPISTRNIEHFLNKNQSNIETIPVPGGRYLHPIERPWELADRCVDWAENSLTTT